MQYDLKLRSWQKLNNTQTMHESALTFDDMGIHCPLFLNQSNLLVRCTVLTCRKISVMCPYLEGQTLADHKVVPGRASLAKQTDQC